MVKQDCYKIVEVEDSALRYEVQRLWLSSGEYVACYKANTLQEAQSWISERRTRLFNNLKEHRLSDERAG